MATTYFDVTAPADQNLLAPEYRAYADLANVASTVELEIIAFYTARAPDALYTYRQSVPIGEAVGAINLARFVFLRGYKASSQDSLTDPQLKDALRRTVALVIEWRIAQRIRNAVMSSSSMQGVSRTYIEQARSLWPAGWTRWLKDFDTREPAWGM